MAESEKKPAKEKIVAGHEPDLLPVRGVLLAIIGLAMLAVLALFVVRGITVWLAHGQTPSAAEPQPDEQMQPRGDPRLDANQPEALHQLRAREAQQLSSIGWIDPQLQSVHIPIDMAMAIVTEQGLPHWPEVQVNSESESAP